MGSTNDYGFYTQDTGDRLAFLHFLDGLTGCDFMRIGDDGQVWFEFEDLY